MDERPRLVEPSASLLRPANVVIIYGFSWHTSESDIQAYLERIYPTASPTTARIYTTPTNGASRGICFAEFARGPRDGAEAARAVCAAVSAAPFAGGALRAVPLHLTKQSWDRRGRLPDLPEDPPPRRARVVEGFGHEGFAVRCGPALVLPNTVSAAGVAHVQALRKKLRVESSGAQ